MTTTENITLEQVRTLSAEAAEHGDEKTVQLCGKAELALYDGARRNPAPRGANAVDLEAVVDIIREAEAQA